MLATCKTITSLITDVIVIIAASGVIYTLYNINNTIDKTASEVATNISEITTSMNNINSTMTTINNSMSDISVNISNIDTNIASIPPQMNHMNYQIGAMENTINSRMKPFGIMRGFSPF
jgi:peptidoglycan hydrolase CwlO-like protein